jgi:acetyl-CoA acetyltransferase
MIIDGLWDAYNQYHMGVTAENVAEARDRAVSRMNSRLHRSKRRSANQWSLQGRDHPVSSFQEGHRAY